MIMRCALIFFATLVSCWPALAEKPILSEPGVLLGRVSVSDLSSHLRLTVDLKGDLPKSTHVMARFQNNRPQQRSASGDWRVWDEQIDSLEDCALVANEDGTLTFDLIDEDLTQHFLPIIFTVAYQTEDGLKSGYVVIDQ